MSEKEKAKKQMSKGKKLAEKMSKEYEQKEKERKICRVRSFYGRS